MERDLDPDLGARIDLICESGDAAAEAGDLADARAWFFDAAELVPEPKHDYAAATWIYTAIGDVDFQAGDWAGARAALEFAVHCPDGLGNPFIHLRLGQALFELGEHDRAADELMRAYMGAGRDIFDDEDPRYFAFLSTRADGLE